MGMDQFTDRCAALRTLCRCRRCRRRLLAVVQCLRLMPLTPFSTCSTRGVAFSFNGGKDSTVLLHIIRAALALRQRQHEASAGLPNGFCDDLRKRAGILHSRRAVVLWMAKSADVAETWYSGCTGCALHVPPMLVVETSGRLQNLACLKAQVHAQPRLPCYVRSRQP